MTQKIEALRNELFQLNQELGTLSGLEPVELAYQQNQNDADSLFIYGIVGGKDVGKTTLINQFAGARISLDTDILDEGTKIAVAYCHEQDINALKKRLTTSIGERIRYVTHQRNVLRNVVLMDFPDFDSRFQSHVEDVQILGKHVQGLVWVVTPRKYGDHEFIDRLETVVQSNENYYVVLNKIDQLANKIDIRDVRQEVIDYLTDECQKRGLTPPSNDRLMLISAQMPQKYEFNRLHEQLIRIHSPEEIARAKAENIRSEFEKNISRLKNYYQLDDHIREIDQALEWVQQTIQSYFPEQFYETVQQRIQIYEQLQRRISHNLFLRRVENWPILRHLCYPLAGLVSFLAGRISFAPPGQDGNLTIRDLLRYEGEPASARMQKIHLEMEEQFGVLRQNESNLPDYQKEVENKFQRLLHQYEDQVITNIKQRLSPPGPMKKFAIYFPLAWFPIFQPILLHFAREEDMVITFTDIMEFFAFLITLIGAGMLLQSVIFLVVFYMICLLLLYAHGARRVLKQGEDEFQNLWFDQFLPWIHQRLTKPLQQMRATWVDRRSALDQVQFQIQAELERILKTK